MVREKGEQEAKKSDRIYVHDIRRVDNEGEGSSNVRC